MKATPEPKPNAVQRNIETKTSEPVSRTFDVDDGSTTEGTEDEIIHSPSNRETIGKRFSESVEEDDSHHSQILERHGARNTTPDPPRTKSKLGKIGGKPASIAYQNVHMEKSKNDQDRQPPRPYSALATKAVKGIVSKTPTMSAASNSLPRSPPQDTAEERANKKREQLKQDLEIQMQAKGKKRRKF